MLQEASAAERIVLIVLLTATLVSAIIAMVTICKRWYLGVGHAVIVGVPAPAEPPTAAVATQAPAANEKQHLLQGGAMQDAHAPYVPLPSPAAEADAAEYELP